MEGLKGVSIKIPLESINSNFIEIKNSLELTNKSYSEARNIYTAEEYLNNFTWLSFWLKRNYIEILEHLMTIIIPISFYILCLKNRGNKNKRIFEHLRRISFAALRISHDERPP